MAEIVSRARAHAEDDIKAHKENQAAELGLNYRFWQREQQIPIALDAINSY